MTESVSTTFGEAEVRLRSYREPGGDPGWFGPDSMAWRVHADLGSMLVGGFAALLLQTLHPLVMQGVADHSNYREDPLGRLRRTAEFLAATTYGGDALASQAVRQVRSIHGHVRGVAPDGRRYRASDPDLVTYVHVTEVWNFLRSYQRYSRHPLLLAEKNQYLEEEAVVARRLGATWAPTSTAAVREYFRRIRPELRRSEAAVAAVRFLRAPIGRTPVEMAAHSAIVEAAIDLLPPFARRELRLGRPLLYRQGLVRPAAATMALLLHWSLGESPVLAAARERAAG